MSSLLDTHSNQEHDSQDVQVCDFDSQPATGTAQLGSLRFQVCDRHLAAARLQTKLLSAPEGPKGQP